MTGSLAIDWTALLITGSATAIVAIAIRLFLARRRQRPEEHAHAALMRRAAAVSDRSPFLRKVCREFETNGHISDRQAEAVRKAIVRLEIPLAASGDSMLRSPSARTPPTRDRRPAFVRRLMAFLPAVLVAASSVDGSAQQFGGARRVEEPMGYPYTAVGKWISGGGGGRGLCTAFLVNSCTLVTASRCAQGGSGRYTFAASDGQRFRVVNIVFEPALTSAGGDKAAKKKPAVPGLDVAFGQIAPKPGKPMPGEQYGRFGFDPQDKVAAIAGFTPHCSYGFSMNEEGKGGRGTLDPDVYVWGALRLTAPDRMASEELFLHMANGVYGASGSPIYRCQPHFKDGTLVDVQVSAPARLVGIFVRLTNDKDALKFPDRLRVDPDDMALGIGGQEFYPELAEYVREHPCEDLR